MSTLARQDIGSPHAHTGGGRLVPEPGNVSHDRAWPLRGLAPGAHTWAVQAVDNAVLAVAPNPSPATARCSPAV